MSKTYKFGIAKGDIEEEFNYNDSWCIEKYPNYERVTVAPSSDQVSFMLDILDTGGLCKWI